MLDSSGLTNLRSINLFLDSVIPFENQIAGHVYNKEKLTIREWRNIRTLYYVCIFKFNTYVLW